MESEKDGERKSECGVSRNNPILRLLFSSPSCSHICSYVHANDKDTSLDSVMSEIFTPQNICISVIIQLIAF